MKTSELERRPEVLSASKNQHGTTVVCRNHPEALAISGEFGGDVERGRLWTVRIPPEYEE